MSVRPYATRNLRQQNIVPVHALGPQPATVGGTYLMFDGLLLAGVAVAILIASHFVVAATEEEPKLAMDFKWKAGTPLPALEDLLVTCQVIGEELGCAERPKHTYNGPRAHTRRPHICLAPSPCPSLPVVGPQSCARLPCVRAGCAQA